MSNAITYTFTSRSGVGSNSHFYIPALPNTFEKLDITAVTVDKVSVPLQYYTINKRNNKIMFMNGVDISIDINENTTITEFITLLNQAIIDAGGTGATLSSITLDDGTTAYRLTILSYDDVNNYFVRIDHSQHYLALVLGLTEGTTFSRTDVYEIPFDNFNGVIFTDYSIFTIRAVATIPPFDQTFTFDIPEGRYTEDELAAQLQTLLLTEGLFTGTTVVFSQTLRKIVFNFEVTTALTYLRISANRLLGFNISTTYPTIPGLLDTFTSLQGISPNPPNLKPTTQVHIRSNQLSLYQRNKKQLWPNIKSIIATIPISKAIKETEVVDLSGVMIKYQNPIKLNYIDFVILADDGSILDIKNAVWTITMTFYYTNPFSL